MRRIFLFSFLLAVFSCSTTPTRKKMAPSDAPVLTQAESEFRAKKVSNVEYDLSFDISDKKESYSGVSKIAFDLSDISSDLRVDFYGGDVENLVINGKNSYISCLTNGIDFIFCR